MCQAVLVDADVDDDAKWVKLLKAPPEIISGSWSDGFATRSLKSEVLNYGRGLFIDTYPRNSVVDKTQRIFFLSR